MKKSLRLFSVIALCLAIPFAAGCAPFDLGSHETFSSWYVASVDALHVDSVGIPGFEGSAAGRTVNAYVVQTPALCIYQVAWSPMIVAALPYYGVKFVTRDPSRGPPAVPDPAVPDPR